MSHIFDGLQRSEGERPESDLDTLTEATELLLRAERRATANWETSILSKQSVATKLADRDMSFGGAGVPSLATTSKPVASPEVSPISKDLDLFSQFQALP